MGDQSQNSRGINSHSAFNRKTKNAVVTTHLGGFLDAQHAVQAIRLGPQCAKRYALDLELPCVWRVLAPTGYRALACAKHRGQLDLRSRKFDCFLPCHAPHYIGKAVRDTRLNFLIEL